MITKKEFQDLARYHNATVVFETSATAVFDGPRFCITIELSEKQMQKANVLEVSDMMAHVAMLN
jgi:hypothetical protein